MEVFKSEIKNSYQSAVICQERNSPNKMATKRLSLKFTLNFARKIFTKQIYYIIHNLMWVTQWFSADANCRVWVRVSPTTADVSSCNKFDSPIVWNANISLIELKVLKKNVKQ